MNFAPCAFAAALVARGRQQADEVAFTWEGEALTYGSLLARALRIADGLRAGGMRRGDRVALLLPAGPPFVLGFAAALLAGAVPFALPAELAAGAALRRAIRGRPALLVTSARRSDSLASASDAVAGPIRVASLESLESSGSERKSVPAFALPDVDPESIAFMQFTSGTTGEPKLVMLSHRALAAWRRSSSEGVDARVGDVHVGWVPPWHIMGLVRYVYLPVIDGSTAHLVEPVARRLGRWLELASEVRATRTSAPDFALRTAVRLAGNRNLDLSSMRAVLTGGENVRRSTIRAFEARFDLPGVVRPSYGLAEATLAVTAVRPGEPLREDATGNLSCGRPLSGVELRVVDSDGAATRIGEPGEIWIRSESLFSGYFDEPENEASRTADGWLCTGDWGHLGLEGELYVAGRRRNLLKHGGATWAPRELEEAAESVAGILASAAISLRRVDGIESGPVVVAELDEERGIEPDLAAQAIAETLRAQLGILAGEILLTTAGTLPRTESGKIRHLELRRRLVAGEVDEARILCGVNRGWTE